MLAGAKRAEFGNRDLEVGEQLEQERLELFVGLVDLVDQQDHLARRRYRAQERTLEQVLAREQMLGDVFPAQSLMLIGLETQELLLIVPLVERARFVESLVALQTDKFGAEHLGQHLRHFGLARAGRPFDEQRLVEREREKDRGLDALVGDIARAPQTVANEFGRDVHLACETSITDRLRF